MRQTDRQRGPAIIHHSRRPPAFSDRMMWVAIRSHLLAVEKALDQVDRTPLIIVVRAALLGIAKAIELRWGLGGRRQRDP